MANRDVIEAYYKELRSLDWDYQYIESGAAWKRGYEAMQRAIMATGLSPDHATVYAAMKAAYDRGIAWPELETILPAEMVAA